ncbi:hypothetical protein AZE42_13472, partial [Rhizopogon vesiculosus]
MGSTLSSMLSSAI